jgi:hypothetical protein
MASKIKVDAIETTTGSGSIAINNTLSGFTSTGIDDNATSTAITIDSSENVGIGVVPESWNSSFNILQISKGYLAKWGTSGSGEFEVGNNAYYDTGYKYQEDGHATKMHQQNGEIKFKVAPSGTADAAISWTTAMTINNNGRISVGTSVSSALLSMENDNAGVYTAYFNNTNNDGPVLKLEHPNTANQTIQTFNNGNGETGKIRTSGTSTAYDTSSDYRLKENVVPMTGSIDRLKALKPSRFNFIADADTTVDGFLAHEAQEVVPEAVGDTPKDAMKTEEYEVTPAVMDGEDVVTEAVIGEREVEDYQGIDQSKLVPLLVASLQEAVARIEILEGGN